MEINAKFKGYCSTCHYTVWQGERAEYSNGNIAHLDCKVALRDATPRTMNPRYVKILGNVNKKKLRQALNN